MQAVAQNTEAATVLGIDVKRMILYVFLINALLAAVAALLVTPTYLAKFDMGDTIGLKAFYAAIIGGFNKTRGAFAGRRARRRPREPDGRLRLAGVQGRRGADAVSRCDPGPSRRPARQGRGAEGMNGRKRALTPIFLMIGLVALALALVPLGFKNYGVYLLTLWCVYVMAGMGLNLTVGYAGDGRAGADVPRIPGHPLSRRSDGHRDASRS
jgi:hypothetical protein